MSVYYNDITLNTVMGRPSYHDLRDTLKDYVEISKIKDGMLTVSSAHTTCSLYFDETMHDVNFYGDEYLQVDINNTLDRLVPKMTSENQYNSPGPQHVDFGLNLNDPSFPTEKWTMLNTDAHIRSSIFGSPSLTFIIRDGELLLGTLGRIYFVDWDQLRERKRTIHVMILGE